MRIIYTATFKKHLKKRILHRRKLYQKFKKRVELFINSPDDPSLRDHKLKGAKKGLRAFSITGDIRVVYYKEGECIYFLDIGTHTQVY